MKEVEDPSLPTPISTPQARTLVDSFRAMLGMADAVKRDKGDGEKQDKHERRPVETLLVKTNLVGVDYVEERRQRLALPPDAVARLPSSLRQTISLKQHQLNGVAWFQHLVRLAPAECRGALLADDMGLGKTIQLLALLGRYYEEQPTAEPSMVIAPKSLVDNWAAEVAKFFDSQFPKVLVLYGDKLDARRQPLGLIDERLRERGIVELLKPDWVGDAKLIITTYETLKRYEFSLARQPFAFVICDEAQRIKTPGTQVSLAVRALKADFRIACTGTPVENSLADLWCLFDFIQPGLLGALEDFSRAYRRPIECTTDEHRDALERLQSLIQPQTLRRTKLEIAHELEKKFFAVSVGQARSLEFREQPGEQERLEVPMSLHQVVLYRSGLKKLQDASSEHDSRRRARLSFGALHLIKAVCAEPYCLPGMKFKPAVEGQDKHLANSPKLAWLLSHLDSVRERSEKAIVFTELREVQSALYYFLKSRFGLRPHIINGDTQSRQRYIDDFSSTEGFDVILLSTLAAGAGLNITAANHVFHFTRAWNPAKENQATDRAYRIGQDKPVYVYCPVSVTPEFVTFDVRLDELMRRKARLSDATIGGSGMESMLNGVANDVSISDLVSGEDAGQSAPTRILTLDDVDRMDGLRFEVLCEMLWTRRGFHAQVTNKAGGDSGVDVVALQGKTGELLQCKSSVNQQVGWDAIKEVVAGAPIYQAMMPNVMLRRLAVTNQTFSESARTRAAANAVQLVEREEVERTLAAHPITADELEARVMEVALNFRAA
jgi:SNF2 family DNA or RNA helicase